MTNTINTVMIYSGNAPIYESIANYFRNMIEQGVLKGGDPLPSVREMAMAERINPNTVAHAYGELVAERLIVSIPKKGYFVAGSLQSKDLSLKKALRSILALGYRKEDIVVALTEMEEEQDDSHR